MNIKNFQTVSATTGKPGGHVLINEDNVRYVHEPVGQVGNTIIHVLNSDSLISVQESISEVRKMFPALVDIGKKVDDRAIWQTPIYANPKCMTKASEMANGRGISMTFTDGTEISGSGRLENLMK